MRVSNFTTPLALFQTISIYNYLNILNNFFHEEGVLTENDRYEPIPTVNGLCDYLKENNHKQERIFNLTRKLLRGSSLYGENENEIPDVHFVHSLFDHIMGGLAFEKHGNVFGFIAKIVRSSNNSSLGNILHRTKIHLNAELKNGFGPDTTLNSCSRERIFKGLIEPLFPNPGEDPELFSVDYIYAQAGYSFLRSGRINSGYFPRENFPTAKKERPDEVIFAEESFDEQIVVGLAIEHLVTSGQLDASALRIFALPAFLYSVHEKKHDFWTERTERIITDPYHWAKAYRLLFSYLNSAFENLDVKKAKKAKVFRESIQKTLIMPKNVSKTRTIDFSKLVKDYMLDDSKIDVTRLIDPGFELASDVGEAGLRSIEKLLGTIGEQFSISFNATKRILERSRKVFTNPPRKIGLKFGTNVYVRSLSSHNDSGYGYKFIYLPDGKMAELRIVNELEGEVPVILFKINSTNEKIYRTIDPTTGKIVGKDLRVKNNKIGPHDLLYRLKQSHRSKAFIEEEETEDRFIKTAASRVGTEDEIIRKVLRSYIFPDVNNETRSTFMNDWLKYGTVPAWSEKYKIEEPEIFHDLMYLPTFEPLPPLNFEKAREMVNNLYVDEELIFLIELGSNDLENTVQVYLRERHYYGVNFEDYYAIRNFGHSAFQRIKESTDEARRMQMALYRSAIRQSDDPLKLFSSTLYRGTRVTRDHIEELLKLRSSGGIYVFGRFISTTRDRSVARNFAGSNQGNPNPLGLIYEMHFPGGRYPRARIEEFVIFTFEEEAVLFPGTAFWVKEVVIENGPTVESLNENSTVSVVMEYIGRERYEWQQYLMKKIKELKNSGTKFYQDDSNLNINSRKSTTTAQHLTQQ